MGMMDTGKVGHHFVAKRVVYVPGPKIISITDNITIDYKTRKLTVDGIEVPGVFLDDLEVMNDPTEIPGVRLTLIAESVTVRRA